MTSFRQLPRTAPAMLVALATAIAFAATGAMALGGGPSPAGQVGCGDTITADTTLDRDLTGCASNGIVIGADDITLDLNGHTVAGDGRSVRRCPRRQICDVGVVNDGHDGITVRDGSVRGFASGVFVGRARRNRRAERFFLEQPVLRIRDRRVDPKPGPRQLRRRQPGA